MQRLVVLAIVTLLGIAPISIVGRSAFAQESSTPTPTDCVPKGANQRGELQVEYKEDPWYGVCKPIAEDATNTAPFQPYAVVFKDEFASTEFITAGNAESMEVHVIEGSFALDLNPEFEPVQILVSTSRDHIERLTPWVDATPPYGTPAPNGDFLTKADGAVCTQQCPVSPGEPVLLMPGDVAVADRGAVCLYCLLHGNRGLLEVFVQLDNPSEPDSFTWIQDWHNPKSTVSTEPVVMAWAFFNPGRCDH